MSNYHKFHNVADENSSATIDTGNQQFQAVNTPFEQRKPLKSWTILKNLTKLQLILAILMIFFESIIIGAITTTGYYDIPLLCTGIWVGTFGVIASSLGIGGFHSQYGHKCLIIGYFVMSIICCLAD